MSISWMRPLVRQLRPTSPHLSHHQPLPLHRGTHLLATAAGEAQTQSVISESPLASTASRRSNLQQLPRAQRNSTNTSPSHFQLQLLHGGPQPASNGHERGSTQLTRTRQAAGGGLCSDSSSLLAFTTHQQESHSRSPARLGISLTQTLAGFAGYNLWITRQIVQRQVVVANRPGPTPKRRGLNSGPKQKVVSQVGNDCAHDVSNFYSSLPSSRKEGVIRDNPLVGLHKSHLGWHNPSASYLQ
jgi:hypothetical protein